MTPINRTLLRVPFDATRDQLTTMGWADTPVPVALTDQVQSAFRTDLSQMGVDTADPEYLAAALAGLGIALKVYIQNNAPVLAHIQVLRIFDLVWPMLDGATVDLSGFEDPELGSYCRQCLQAAPAGAELCLRCQKARAAQQAAQNPPQAISELFQRMGLTHPSIGGPGFNRPAEAIPEAPKRKRWWRRG